MTTPHFVRNRQVLGNFTCSIVSSSQTEAGPPRVLVVLATDVHLDDAGTLAVDHEAYPTERFLADGRVVYQAADFPGSRLAAYVGHFQAREVELTH